MRKCGGDTLGGFFTIDAALAVMLLVNVFWIAMATYTLETNRLDEKSRFDAQVVFLSNYADYLIKSRAVCKSGGSEPMKIHHCIDESMLGMEKNAQAGMVGFEKVFASMKEPALRIGQMCVWRAVAYKTSTGRIWVCGVRENDVA